MADRYSFSLTTFSPRLVFCAVCHVQLLTKLSGKLVQIGTALLQRASYGKLTVSCRICSECGKSRRYLSGDKRFAVRHVSACILVADFSQLRTASSLRPKRNP